MIWLATCGICGIFTRIMSPDQDCRVCGCQGDYTIEPENH